MWLFDSGYFAGSEFQYFIVLGTNEYVYVFAGVDGIECFAIETSIATKNWLKNSEG